MQDDNQRTLSLLRRLKRARKRIQVRDFTYEVPTPRTGDKGKFEAPLSKGDMQTMLSKTGLEVPINYFRIYADRGEVEAQLDADPELLDTASGAVAEEGEQVPVTKVFGPGHYVLEVMLDDERRETVQRPFTLRFAEA